MTRKKVKAAINEEDLTDEEMELALREGTIPIPDLSGECYRQPTKRSKPIPVGTFPMAMRITDERLGAVSGFDHRELVVHSRSHNQILFCVMKGEDVDFVFSIDPIKLTQALREVML